MNQETLATRTPHDRGEQAVVTVAVLGTGSIGTRHLGALHRVAGVSPIAVPKRPQRRDELAGRGETTARTLEEAAAAGATHAIIATDTGCHVEDGLEALGLGFDLLVEKPLSVNALEANRLAQT